MQSASNFILNIVELQNVVTSITGASPQATLATQLSQIGQMVNFDAKQINVNVISNFDTSPIQVVAPINLSNVSLTTTDATGITTTVGGSNTTLISTIGSGQSGSLEVGGITGGLKFYQNGVSTFYITTTADAVFTGTVSATNFITISDRNAKTNIERVVDYETILSSVNGVRFNWCETGVADIGVIAQEVEPVLPEAVMKTEGGMRVAYHKLVPVLVEAVKGLQARVSTLEALTGQVSVL